MVYCAQQIVK